MSFELVFAGGGVTGLLPMEDSLLRFVDATLQALDLGGEDFGEKPGQTIGPYTLVECLGQGGFGTVWLASQSRPIRRQVAIKIIKMGMDTREVTARFELERQSLAVMDHPGIAKVFDAGATLAGRPYFVMEVVRGTPITRHCDEAALSVRERLELFIHVCEAVRHAHQKGVVHRDLKPSNLIVTEVDSKPAPKVIDFGIAKAMRSHELTDMTLVTRMDRIVGTPAYMSPEQSQPGCDIDTRADIYSLGVVLYELITGRVPFEPGGNKRVIERTEVKRPSAVLRSQTKEQLQGAAEARSTDGPRLINQVKGDLDWIVVKALECDRERRYESADALAGDLRAYLERRPVTARPPTAWYLATRFAQRHKMATASVLAVFMVLTGAISASTFMYYRTQKALKSSQQVTHFLQRTLAQAGPSRALGRDSVMLREILDKTSQRIAAELRNQPKVEAELRSTIAHTYVDLGEYALAHTQSIEALRLRRALGEGDSTELADAIFLHGLTLEVLGRFKEAEPGMREALAMRERLYGADDPRTAAVHIELAWILKYRQAWDEAEVSARIAVHAWRKDPGNYLLRTAPPALAGILHHTNRHEESLSIFKEDVEGLRKLLGPEHPEVAACLDNLGDQLCRMKRFDEAEPVLLEALRQGKLFFNDHIHFGYHTFAGLSRVAASRQQWDRQLEYAREGFDSARKVYGADQGHSRGAASLLAKVLLEQAEREVRNAPQRTLALLDELEGSKEFASAVKQAGGWLDCLRGAAMGAEASRRDEGRELIRRGLEALKAKDKPSDDDRRRLKQAEAFLEEDR